MKLYTKLIIGVLVLTMTLTSCGKRRSDNNDVSEKEKVKVNQETLGQIEEEQVEINYDLNIENNLSDKAELNVVHFVPIEHWDKDGNVIDTSGYEARDYDIYYANLGEFQLKMGLSYCDFKDKEVDGENYKFAGKGYGYPISENNITDFGTVFYVEGTDMATRKEHIADIRNNEKNYENTDVVVKGINISTDDISSDYTIVFFGGIRVRKTTKAEVEKKIGTGSVSKDNENIVYYKNTKNSMIIRYANSNNKTVVAEVTVINNYSEEFDNLTTDSETFANDDVLTDMFG